MGWWQISEKMVNGDGPADIMEDAIAKISKEYQKDLGREPYKEELEAVLEFCVSSANLISSGEIAEDGPGIHWGIKKMNRRLGELN